MADCVIVVGSTRGRMPVPSSEIVQMCGRAGRIHGGSACRAILVVTEEESERLKSEMSDVNRFAVSSSFSILDVLAFHILPEICSGRIKDPETVTGWYSRTLAHAQGIKLDVSALFEHLVGLESIRIVDGDTISATELGQVSARFYFHPADLRAWRNNFSCIFESGLETDDLAIAWALGSIPKTRISGNLENRWDALEHCKNGIPPGLEVVPGTIIAITLWSYLLGGFSVGKMKNQAMIMRSDCGRICRALCEVDKHVTHWDMLDFFGELESRLKGGIPSHLMSLCRFTGMTKGRAAFLYDMGIRDANDVRDSLSSIEGEVDGAFRLVLRGIANGIRR